MLFKVIFWLCCGGTTYFVQSDRNRDAPKLRIIGGKEAKTNYPFMISLQMYGRKTNIFGKDPPKYHHICGGSIVGENCIVTAAHCVENSSSDALSVLVGTNDLRNDKLGDRYYLQNYTIHHKYSPLTESDIAVIRLNESIRFSECVGPIEQSTEFVGAKVNLLLIGWGHTSPVKFGTPPLKLQALNTTSMSNEECNKNPAVKASDTDLCTYERMGKGACNGDSGGPLILYRDGKPILVAVVSRGFIICSMFRIPDIFTRASVFYDWINEQCCNDAKLEPVGNN